MNTTSVLSANPLLFKTSKNSPEITVKAVNLTIICSKILPYQLRIRIMRRKRQ